MGRPYVLDAQQKAAVVKALTEGARVADLARTYGVGVSTVSRLLPVSRRRGPRTRVLDLVGRTYGRWTVLHRVPRAPESKRYATYFMCRCACGTEKEVRGTSLTQGDSRSCLECHNDRLRKNSRRNDHDG